MQFRVRRTPQIAALCAPADRDERNRRNSNLASCSPAYSAWALHLYYLGRNIIRFLRSVAMPKCLPVPPTMSGRAGISYRVNAAKSQDRAPAACATPVLGGGPELELQATMPRSAKSKGEAAGLPQKERGAARRSFNRLGSWMPGRAWRWLEGAEGRAKTNIQPLPMATRDKPAWGGHAKAGTPITCAPLRHGARDATIGFSWNSSARRGV